MPKSDNWSTPPALIQALRKEFQFTLEVCAAADNRAMPDIPYMGLDNDLDAMHNDWGPKGSVCFCNPPYSALTDFVTRATEQSAEGRTIIQLIPAYPGTLYFQDFVAQFAQDIRFLRGRLTFWENGVKGKYPARFDSAIVVWTLYGHSVLSPAIHFWDWRQFCT